jgi:pimeloyl-ACP methyl ester carboxylesterase
MRKVFVAALIVFYPTGGWSQELVNNLVHTLGYETSVWGTLPDLKVFGSGEKKMILLPGWGFDWTIFDDFIKAHSNEYTLYAITFPGFGKTHAPPMPESPESYKDLYWSRGIIKAIANLIDKEKLVDPVVVSYFTYSNLIAMRLALDYPDKVGSLIIISGMAKFTINYPSYEPRSLAQRISYVENVLSKQWFKSVSKDTWDKGNFAPETFCKDTIKARQYWNMMSSVPIPVMVRYLCEYYCTDISLEYSKLTTPTLVVVPAFTPKVYGDNPYLGAFFHYSWLGALPASSKIQIVTLSDTQAFITADQPAKLYSLIKEFLSNPLVQLAIMR